MDQARHQAALDEAARLRRVLAQQRAHARQLSTVYQAAELRVSQRERELGLERHKHLKARAALKESRRAVQKARRQVSIVRGELGKHSYLALGYTPRELSRGLRSQYRMLKRCRVPAAGSKAIDVAFYIDKRGRARQVFLLDLTLPLELERCLQRALARLRFRPPRFGIPVPVAARLVGGRPRPVSIGPFLLPRPYPKLRGAERRQRQCRTDRDCVVSCVNVLTCCPNRCRCTNIYSRSYLRRLTARQHKRCAGRNCGHRACPRRRYRPIIVRCIRGLCRKIPRKHRTLDLDRLLRGG